MASWNEIKAKICKTTDKVVAKTGEVADTAAKHVKLKAMDGKLSQKYETLGRIYYKMCKNSEEQTEKVEELVAEIEALIAEKKALKAEIEADKQRRAEAKKAKEEAEAACEAECAEESTEAAAQ
jgi:ElaB/YqjD/DUF883 family membrane-anchored ribosome-binding protein